MSEEREAIVAWLRVDAEKWVNLSGAGTPNRAAEVGAYHALHLAADAIKRGEHLAHPKGEAM